MKAIYKQKWIFIVALFISTLAVISCRKKGDTNAVITVLDIDNQPVEDVRVILRGIPSSSDYAANEIVVNDTAFTDGLGQARFDYNDVYQLGQAGVAVLEIIARKDTLVGLGNIKIVEETTSEQTVIIQPM